MPRRTSLLAYQTIQANGMLSDQRWRVYDHLFHYGPLTAGELGEALRVENQPHPSYHRRLDELGDLGCAFRVRIRPCRITNHEAVEWDVTDQLPSGKIQHHPSGISLANIDGALLALDALYLARPDLFSDDLKLIGHWLFRKSQLRRRA